MTITDVMRDPFGPYPASLILNTNPGALPRALILDSVTMLFASSERITGLEETDTKAYEDLAEDVHIYGDLVIEKLDWLSEDGKEILGEDLRERDQEVNPYNRGELTVQRIIRDTKSDDTDERKLKVTIQCKKEMPAAFLTANKYSTSLVMYSWISERKGGNLTDLIIRSFEAQSFEKSLVYLERWRLHAFVLQTIKEQNSPPLEKRTVQWLIAAMRERYKRDSAHRRLIFDPEDTSDIEDLETGETKRRRHPLHLSRAECAHILATHVEWFLAQQLLTKSPEHRHVNLRNWYEFCLKSKQKKPREFGTKPDFVRFGHDRRWWDDTIQKQIYKKKPKKQAADVGIDLLAPQDGEEEEDSKAYRANYDPDFAGEESSEYSDSSYDDSRSSNANLNSLKEKVPWYCRREPEFRDWIWECPDDNCHFQIDLRDVRYPAADRLRESLSLQGKKMKKLVLPRIAEHYEYHMHQNGVHMVVLSKRPLRTDVVEWPLQPGVHHPQPPAQGVKEEIEN
ncbi:hypothetical protein L218DRAFT_998504 [Marasmius fiardii PR-910]|nr:hypothetical protein L218DRAFT_998504 [Marasmius fiardii PR-910]